MFSSIITGTGSCIPEEIYSNQDFFNHVFYNANHHRLDNPAPEVIEKFRQLTGISHRRYASNRTNTSDLAVVAAKKAIDNSGIDPETIDQIVVAHNFGDVKNGTAQADTMPSLASRVKHQLNIANANCVAYDILFGCPGWLQALIHADAFFKAGLAKRSLVIGAETLSRVIDRYDRDSMIFADGAGACILEYTDSGTIRSGIISTAMQSHTGDAVHLIDMGNSYHPDADNRIRYMKMKGRQVFEFAMQHVPGVMKAALDKSGYGIHELKKVFIHQTNEKMDLAIVKAFYQQYGVDQAPENVLPMSIQWLGNSSVATIPTLYDLVCHGQIKGHEVHSGDLVIFVSVGGGMNINAVCYKQP